MGLKWAVLEARGKIEREGGGTANATTGSVARLAVSFSRTVSFSCVALATMASQLSRQSPRPWRMVRLSTKTMLRALSTNFLAASSAFWNRSLAVSMSRMPYLLGVGRGEEKKAREGWGARACV